MAAIQALEPQLHSNLEALHSSNVEEQLRSIFERLCGHDNNQIRCASILAITRIDPSPTTTVILNQQLTNPSSLIRYAACLSLAKISTPDALSILSKTTKGTDERLTLFAAAALATQNEITEAEETETQTILLEALQKKFFPRLVMGALENAGNSKRNVWLLKTLAAQKKATPLWLLAALRRSAHLDLTVKQRQQTVRLLDHFHNHTDPLVRLGVMQVYEALSENSAIPRLLDHCRSDCSTAVRKSAVQALAEIGTPEADKALARLVIKSLEQADSEPCGRYLFRVLGDRNLSEASQALWNVLDSTHLQYQLAAAQALANQISRAPHRKHAIAKQRLVDFLKNIENKLADSTAEKVDISRLRVMWMSAWQILSLNKPVNRNAPLRRPK
jgi:HEAT repeat protein